MNSEKLDHEYTHDIVCPYCGANYDDCYEADDYGEIECDNCGNLFDYSRHTDITYSTERKQCKKCNLALQRPSYIYNGKNWSVYECSDCQRELIKTGIIINNTPYDIPIDAKDVE